MDAPEHTPEEKMDAIRPLALKMFELMDILNGADSNNANPSLSPTHARVTYSHVRRALASLVNQQFPDLREDIDHVLTEAFCCRDWGFAEAKILKVEKESAGIKEFTVQKDPESDWTDVVVIHRDILDDRTQQSVQDVLDSDGPHDWGYVIDEILDEYRIDTYPIGTTCGMYGCTPTCRVSRSRILIKQRCGYDT